MFEVSPGVYFREIDLSNYVPALSTTQFGVVGTASKGPVNEKVLITSKDDLVRKFGYPSGHLALFAADKYLDEGNQLWYVRVAAATGADALASASTSVTLVDTTTVDVDAKDPGSFYNDIILQVGHSNPRNTQDSDLGDAIVTVFNFTLAPGRIVPGTVTVTDDGAVVATDDGAGALEGAGISAGTVDYDTGAVSVTFNAAPADGNALVCAGTYYSTFQMELVKTISGRTYVLESYRGLNLTDGKENYYADALVGSRLIQVPTFADFPAVGNYTMAGGEDGLLELTASDYVGINTGSQVTGLQLFSNVDELDINAVAVPGQSDETVVQALVTLAETRRDCVAIIDPPYNLAPESVTDWIDGAGAYSAQNAINSSYATVFYPWVRINDPYAQSSVWVPPSGWVAAAFARTDRVSDIFYAPFGPTRGRVLGALQTERLLDQGKRDFLYQNRVNPIADFVATGILLWGQKTTQVIASDLDRLHARRTLNYLEKIIVTALYPLVGEPNNRYTWARAEAIVQPVLDGFIARGGLYDGRIVCNEVTNPDDVIAQNRMIANVFLQLVKTAEIITVNFILLPTGAQIEEYVGRQF